jgi:hypothetical protein
MRPSRMSVASLAFAGESPASARVVFVFLMRELCGTEDESTNEGIYNRFYTGATRRLMSAAWVEWVRRPMEIKSTPVSA